MANVPIGDPFYKEILDALANISDGNLFQRCAASLLAPIYPTLLHIEGGSDAGMDGAFFCEGKNGYFICTISPGVIENFTKNVLSHQKTGDDRKQVLVATSQELSTRKRASLRARAKKLGISIVDDPYDRTNIAELLYHDPRWCKALLGLSGQPSALSPFLPRRLARPDLTSVGRERELKWLITTPGDRLVVVSLNLQKRRNPNIAVG